MPRLSIYFYPSWIAQLANNDDKIDRIIELANGFWAFLLARVKTRCYSSDVICDEVTHETLEMICKLIVITDELLPSGPAPMGMPVVIRENLFFTLNRLKIRGSATWLWRRSLSIFYAFTDPSKSFSFSPPNGLADSLPLFELIFVIRFWLRAKSRI